MLEQLPLLSADSFTQFCEYNLQYSPEGRESYSLEEVLDEILSALHVGESWNGSANSRACRYQPELGAAQNSSRRRPVATLKAARLWAQLLWGEVWST